MSQSSNCFVTDKALTEPVEVIDVVASPLQQPASPAQQQQQQQQQQKTKQSEFKDNTSLTTHLSTPNNKNYISRYMSVPLILQHF
jgi:type IV secretory pathway VirB10-like protein